ncbi:ROK family protein [Haloferula sp. A504]|uniref:ROK family protein n=1 Tax=Haloferula sp. A504 TaxID=3373601 RepID=UPI0031BE4018|nr:ROK family protein [Verrucomicrobiaceae bacterium E54]
MSDSIFIGIDGGATTSKIAAVRGDGSIVSMDLQQQPTGSEGGPSGVIDGWLAGSNEFLERNGLGWDQVQGIGISVPGPYLEYGVMGASPNLPPSFDGWRIIDDMTAAVEKRIGRRLPMVMGNDGNFAGVAEAARVREKGGGSVALLAPGSGLGGAFVDATGLPLEGSTISGMEIGHIPAPLQVLGAKAYRCGCGRDWGCFEMYTSLAGLPYLFEEALERYPDHPLAKMDGTPKERILPLRGLAQEGDELALELFDFQAKAMGLLIGTLSMTVDPDVFVVGGGLIDPDATTPEFRARYLGGMRETALEYLWPVQRKRLNIVEAELGELSQAIGAALVVLLQRGAT